MILRRYCLGNAQRMAKNRRMTLEPFCKGEVGHQYFGDEEDDDVLFEIEFGE